jgi:hypothetical protein
MFGQQGAAQSTPAGGLFGNTTQPAPASTGGMFGSTAVTPAATGGMFGSTAVTPAATGGMFGSTAVTPAATGGMFGSQAGQPSTGLFGNTASQLAAPGNIGSTNQFNQTQSAITLKTKFSELPPATQQELDQMEYSKPK